MAITGVYNTKFEVGDEVLYLDVCDDPYMNGVVKEVIKIAGGPDRLTVLLDNGQWVYNNCHKFVKVHKMGFAEPKIKPLFKKGDRVISKDKKATVSTNRYNDYYYSIFLDQPYNGYQHFTVNEETITMANSMKPEKEYTIKCAEWFKTAYAVITKAGGVPEYVIDSIPVDVLDNLIRNDLHLEYKK